MRYVYGGVQITFNWTIWKKANTVKEDFDQSELRVLLYGPADKYYIPVEITGNGDVAGQLPESLPAGVYSMKAFWTKEALRANGRVLESEQNCFIAITYNETEVESTSRDICLHLQSAISTYGKDGLSAYEIAVLLGQTQLKESEWSNVNVDLAEAEHERVLAEEARDTAEAGRVTAEAGRVTAEQGRVSAETGRVSAEESRVAAEASRVEAESARVAAETARGTAETARENAEDLRELAETARGAAESSRRDAENARELAEQAREDAFDAHEAARQAVFETSEASRAQAFSTSESARTAAFNTTQATRQATFESSEEDRTTTFGISEAERAATFNQNENARAVAEAGRVSAEQGRVSAEQGRVSAEASRVSAEAGRVSAEAGRVSAEASRVTAEEAREAAEEIRQENYAETIKYIPQELTSLQQVKAKANLGLPNDTVFDVSKFNEYEGELHAYADLTAALEGLPAEYHVGGVSIKFINSVSGKYETWTLMDNSWSSDVADWQGVDDEPTAGSENLVKSGGVDNELRPEVTITRDTNPKTGFINSSNTFVPYSGSGITLCVNSGDVVSVYAKDTNAFVAFLKKDCYSDSLEFCSDFPSRINIDVKFKKVYTVPSDCKYLYVTYSTSNTTLGFPVITINNNFVIGSIGNTFNEHNDRIQALNLQINGNNAEYCKDTVFINSDLNLRRNEGDSSYFVPVKTGDTLFVKASTSYYSLICFVSAYGSSNNVILMAGETERRSFTIQGTTFVSPGDGLAIIADTVYQYPQTHIVKELSVNGLYLIKESEIKILEESIVNVNGSLNQEIERAVDAENILNEKIDVDVEGGELLPIFINAALSCRSRLGDYSYVVPVNAGDSFQITGEGHPNYILLTLVKEYPVIDSSVVLMSGQTTRLNYSNLEIEIPENGFAIITKGVNGQGDNVAKITSLSINGINKFHKSLQTQINDEIERATNAENEIRNSSSTSIYSEKNIFDLESYWKFISDYFEDKYSALESEALIEYINKITERRNNGLYQIAVISDTHGTGAYSYLENADNGGSSCLRSIAVFNKIAALCDIAFHGGDISVDYGTSRHRYLSYMRNLIRQFRFNKPFFITKGNHDENNNVYVEANMLELDWDNTTYYKRNFSTFTAVTRDQWKGDDLYVSKNELISDTEFRNIAQQWLCPSDAKWGNGAYYYYDIEALNLRIIVGNSFPVSDSYDNADASEYIWFAQEALNFSEKAVPSEWKTIVLRHTEATGLEQFANLINAFKNGESWTGSGITVDFGTINGGPMTFIAHIHGHEHHYCFSNGKGFLDVGEAIGCCLYNELGNATKYGISVLSVDFENGKIYEDTISGHTWVYNFFDNKLELKIGESFTIAESGLQRPVTASSSDTNIATCNGQKVTAVGVGDVTITANGNNGDYLEYKITVVAEY